MSVDPLQLMPLPIAGLFGLVGLILLGLAVRELWLAVQYRSLRPTPVGELTAASGNVVVTGTAQRTDETVTAPITRQDCLAYAWRVSDLRTVRGVDGSIETRRTNAGSGRDSVSFSVTDDTGSVLVDPAGAELRLAEQWIADPAGDPADRAGILTGIDQFGGEARGREFYESRLDDGETVTVRGRVAADGSLSVSRLGIRITGGGTLIEDGTPRAAARRALLRAVYAGGAGVFVLGFVLLFSDLI